MLAWMALTATMHTFRVQLSDIDRQVYETFELKVAQQPSETAEYMLSRVLAYCLEYTPGISLTEGVAATNEPAVIVRDLTGQISGWIDVGAPDADRMHRATKVAAMVAVYTHRPIRVVLGQLTGKKIHRASEVSIYTFGQGFVEEVASVLGRRNDVALTVTERQVYLEVYGRTFTTTVEEHRLG